MTRYAQDLDDGRVSFRSTTPSHFSPRAHTPADDRVREAICDRLLAAQLSLDEIEISVDHGEVTLEGKVSAETTRHFVEQLCAETPGTTMVHNRLAVWTSLY